MTKSKETFHLPVLFILSMPAEHTEEGIYSGEMLDMPYHEMSQSCGHLDLSHLSYNPVG